MAEVAAEADHHHRSLEDITSHLLAMHSQELAHYVIPDYLAVEWQLTLKESTEARRSTTTTTTTLAPSGGGDRGSSSNASNNDDNQLNEQWREDICEWFYQIADNYYIHREVVSVAMAYLDRYAAAHVVNRRIFQLAAMTSLYLAIKLYEPPGKLCLTSLLDLSRGLFVVEHIVIMENLMLQSLQWYVLPPTPLAYCREIMNLVSNNAILSPVVRNYVYELARFLTELSVTDYWFVTKERSSIAVAALNYAIELRLQGGCGGGGWGRSRSGCTGAAGGGQGRQQQRITSTTIIENNPHNMDFLSHVGKHFTKHDEIVECYERLVELYRSGGYSPRDLKDDKDNNDDEEERGLEEMEDDDDDDDDDDEEMGLEEEEEEDDDADEEGGARMSTISPMGVAEDGPDALLDVSNRSITAGAERKRKHPG